MKWLKQLLCNHYFWLEVYQINASVGDEHKNILSLQLELKCMYCGKTYKVLDRTCRHTNWLISKTEPINIKEYC